MSLAANIASRNDVRDAFVAKYPAGSRIRFFNGSVPATDTAATGTVIANVTLPATPWDTSVNGVASKAAGSTWQTTTTLAGTPTYARIENAAVTKWEQITFPTDGTVSAVATNGDLYNINSIAITFP